MDPPWIKEGLSVGLVVGISGGGEGMLGGRLVLLKVTGILWTSWLGPEWRTERNRGGGGRVTIQLFYSRVKKK